MSDPMIQSIAADDLEDLRRALKEEEKDDQIFCLELFFEAQSFPNGWKRFRAAQTVLNGLVRDGIIDEAVRDEAMKCQRAVIASTRRSATPQSAEAPTSTATVSRKNDRKTSVAERQATTVRESQSSGPDRGGFASADACDDNNKDSKPSTEERHIEKEGVSSREHALEESKEEGDNEEEQQQQQQQQGDDLYSPCSETEEGVREIEIILGVRAAQNRTPQMCHPVTPPQHGLPKDSSKRRKKSDSGRLSKNLQGSEPKQQRQGSLNGEPLFWVQCEKCDKVRVQVRFAVSHGVNFYSLLKQNVTLLCLFFILWQWRVLVGEDSNIVINGKWFCHMNEDPLNDSCKPLEKDKLWYEGYIAGFSVSGFSPARPFWRQCHGCEKVRAVCGRAVCLRLLDTQWRMFLTLFCF